MPQEDSSVALSLEVKKFINSEHVGKFVEIHLPLEGEPVRPPKKNKKSFKKVLTSCNICDILVEYSNGTAIRSV